MRFPALFALLLVCTSVAAQSAAVTSAAAIGNDPPTDPAHPARLAVVHIPSHGVKLNGVMYVASGAGLHPTAILFHGLPGNEQNLDLAQALRRAGWNVLTLHYQGAWGSPGNYSYHHLVDDGAAALAFVRSPANAVGLGIDTKRVVLLGDSTGGFVAALTAAGSSGLAGLVLISASDDAGEAVVADHDPAAWRKWVNDNYADSREGLSGCTPEGLAREVLRQAALWSFASIAPKLTHTPMLMITADDGLASDSEALAAAIGKHGGAPPNIVHMTTDHAYSDHRIALETAVLNWLQEHNQAGAP